MKQRHSIVRIWWGVLLGALLLLWARPSHALEGIGAAIVSASDAIYAFNVFPESPAARAGMRSGDRIVSINGRSTKGMSNDDAVGLLRGEKGSQLRVAVLRNGAKVPKSLTIVRDEIEVPEQLVRQIEAARERQATARGTAMALTQQQATFILEPQSFDLQPGTETRVALLLSNPASLPIDAWQATIMWDIRALELLGYAPGASVADGSVAAWSAEGRLVLRHVGPQRSAMVSGEVASLVFRANPTPGRHTVSFVRGKGTFAAAAGADLLGSPDEERDGLVDGVVEIARSRSGKGPLSRRPRIRLVAGETDANTGGACVYLRLLNPDRAPIATVDVTLRFDPDELLATDSDKGNWVRAGVNACDGPYHNEFPFDLHHVNSIDNGQGVVRYRMGSERDNMIPSGTFARVDFRFPEGVSHSIILAARTEVTCALTPGSFTDEPDATSRWTDEGVGWVRLMSGTAESSVK